MFQKNSLVKADVFLKPNIEFSKHCFGHIDYLCLSTQRIQMYTIVY
jgi:hypothetical protein